ncbi:F-box protein [Nesidiocoris tenuis]|uniref:F-box protein n=1 Tax=Nesidiocoris tenuis TaxID=355587 RepID=A0ABN7AZX5_9HEMI|nr:F-box protein [Nesidiocoris tenuis]
MPFISKDWRSPGEFWVKTEEGWEKAKILECSSLNSSIDKDEEEKENIAEQNKDCSIVQPYCHITKSSKEVAGFTGLSDALKRLDWKGAVRDRRRFKYICKLLDLLCNERPLSELSGNVRKTLFTMLEEVALQVRMRQENTDVLRKLIVQLRSLVDCACWGRPIGSTQLWQSHLAVIHRITHIADNLVIQMPEGEPLLEDMPEEVIREVLLRLSDHKDIEACREAWPETAGPLTSEQRIWRKLVAFHFTDSQVSSYFERKAFMGSKRDEQELQVRSGRRSDKPPVDWKDAFHYLRKHYGLREDYAETLSLCRACRCLYWTASGHPCVGVGGDPSCFSVIIRPSDFLNFFTL